jgi:predicted Zn-dependent protease with MMP-like domain
MDRASFKKLVADIGFLPVPEKFRGLIENAALLVEDDVPEETRRDMELAEDETLLGLYHGIPQTARGESYGIAGTLPDTITLYRRPILVAAGEDGTPVRQVVEETIWHEVAHHFGLNEAEVAKREKGRKRS